MGQIEIYALVDPRTGERRYIGKANSATKRLKSHVRDARRRRTPVYDWISKLAGLGMSPILEIICSCPKENWQAVERQEIASARAAGVRLLNLADGGDEPFCPRETRAANARKNAIARVDTEQKARLYHLKRKVGLALKNGLASESGKEKLRLAARLAPNLFGEYASV